ncbi:nucleotidyltransferase family protein [Fluviispira sanaruensis]|uniref:Nucleotidyl transferase domain-containing protein n=1 Tax=Fluviispira sanaruensis TaxID=2493639 RepID=A0A4P2VYL9_FLUSA|nr:NDP-sugar synthase [Fluviispira sanaruensis]BBH54092.1 hypothetical protein JCM31447_25490 [Fluviispira sanaruensis]
MIKNQSINYQDYCVAILAGGKGTRIQSLFPDIPKPLVEIAGKQVLLRQIDFFLEYGVKKIIVLAGFRGEVIKERLYKKYNNLIDVVIEETPLGTSGCLSLIKKSINTKYLIFVSGDLVFDIDLERFCSFHQGKKAQCTLTVHSNFHPMDADLISFDEITLKVIALLVRPHPQGSYYLNNVNAAISILNVELLSYIEENNPKNFERDFIPLLVKNKIDIYAYKSIEYIRDMGTPERFNRVSNDLSKFLPEKLKYSFKKKSIFIDMATLEKVFLENNIYINNKLLSDINKINYSEFILTGFFYKNSIKREFIETVLGNRNLKLDTFFNYWDDFEGELRDFINEYNISDISFYSFNF